MTVWRAPLTSRLPWSLTDRRSPWGAAILWVGLICGGAALASLPLEELILLCAGGALALLTLLRPAIGLAVLAIIVPFGSLRELSIGPAAIGLSEAWAAFVLCAWIANLMALRRGRPQWSRLWLALGLLISAMLLSITQALSLGSALKELSKWLELAAIAVCATTLTEERDRRLIIGATLLAGIAAALQGWYQFLLGLGPPGFILFGQFMRAYGAFRQPNPYAGYLGLLFPVAFSILISYWPWRRGHKWAERALWLLAVAAVATIGPAILMSWSRGAWFGVAAGILLVILGRGWRWALLALVLGLALAGIIFVTDLYDYAPTALTTRITDFAGYFSWGDVSAIKPNPTNWAVIERMAHWQAAARMFTAHPWLGIGIGNYAAVYPVYRLERWADPLGHAHNYYLNIAAESGLIGLSAYILFWGAAIGVTWRAIRRQTGLWRGVALGILGAFLHLSIHNLFDNLFVQGIYLQIALWLGLAVSLSSPLMRESCTRNGIT